MPTALAERYFHARLLSAQRDADPLAYWRFGFKPDALARVRQALELFTAAEPIDELHFRACNKGLKTYLKAAFTVACLQKREHLAGVRLPQWKGPVQGLQLVRDFPQQLLSVKQAYLSALGNWPHHPTKHGDHLVSIHVMPVGGDPQDERHWSVAYFLSQKNFQSGTGARADIIDFDEPPVMAVLRELRKAAHAGRRVVILIGETPTKRREWSELFEDYGDTPRSSLRRVDQDRAEVRWSLDEVADWVLSPEEKDKLRRKYALDPLREAREHGDYINETGRCPLDVQVLELMLALCRDPEVEEWRVSREISDAGDTTTVARVPVEVWTRPEPGKTYYLDVDPASGVDDRQHNPAGLHVTEQGSGDLVVRWNGYLAPYSVGVLGAGLARQYNDSPIDIEMKDHWGVNVVRGVTASRYGNLCYERRELTPGRWAKEVGFDNNEETRAVIIGCIQEWLAAWRAALREDGTFGPGIYGRCPSRAVLNTLLDTELDDRGKIVAGPGIAHGEDMILRGQALRRCVRRLGAEIPRSETLRTPEQRIAALIQGQDQERAREPRREPAPEYRERPRL